MAPPDEFLKQVGRVTVNFSLLDFYLGVIIGALMNVHADIGLMVTSEQSFRQKLSLLSSLAKHFQKLSGRPQPVIPELQALIARMANLEERRNAVTHSIWASDEKQDDRHYRIKISAKQSKGLHHGFEEFSVSDLTNLADELKKTAEEILPLAFMPKLEPRP